MAGSVPGVQHFLSSTLQGLDEAARGREGSRLPAACYQPFLSLGGGRNGLSIRGDFARGACCVALPLDAPRGAGIRGVNRALESFEEARGGARDGQLLPVDLDFRENLAEDNK